MRLFSRDDPPIQMGAGTAGFGAGYWFHFLPGLKHWYDPLYDGQITFVSKTLTAHPHAGNTPLMGRGFGYTPKEFKPKAIRAYPVSGALINNVALSNPGAREVLAHGGLFARTEPFFVSFAAVKATRKERMRECEWFARTFMDLQWQHGRVGTPMGLQINLCPNADVTHEDALAEVPEMLDILSVIEGPKAVKVSLMSSPSRVKAIHDHHVCDALCVTNSLPLRNLSRFPRLYDRFARDTVLGGGSLSGRPLLLPLIAWLKEQSERGITKPVIAGGGILSADDVARVVEGGLLRKGVDAVSIASAAVLRPWNIRSIVAEANRLLA
jgi:dihydroorotate dehydrogenase